MLEVLQLRYLDFNPLTSKSGRLANDGALAFSLVSSVQAVLQYLLFLETGSRSMNGKGPTASMVGIYMTDRKCADRVPPTGVLNQSQQPFQVQIWR